MSSCFLWAGGDQRRGRQSCNLSTRSPEHASRKAHVLSVLFAVVWGETGKFALWWRDGLFLHVLICKKKKFWIDKITFSVALRIQTSNSRYLADTFRSTEVAVCLFVDPFVLIQMKLGFRSPFSTQEKRNTPNLKWPVSLKLHLSSAEQDVWVGGVFMVPLMVVAVKVWETSATVVRGPVSDGGDPLQREADRFGIGHLFQQTLFFFLWQYSVVWCVAVKTWRLDAVMNLGVKVLMIMF